MKKTPEEKERQQVWQKFIDINKDLMKKDNHIQYYDKQINIQ